MWRWFSVLVCVGFAFWGLTSEAATLASAVVSFAVMVVAVSDHHANGQRRSLIVATPRVRRFVIVELCLVIACAIGGAIGASLPSMAHGAPISRIAAPAIFAAIAIFALRALQLRSPRRMVLLSLVTLIAWPICLGLRFATQIGMEFDGQWDTSTSWLVDLYTFSGAIAASLVLALGAHAARPDAPTRLPEARLASGG